MENKIYKRLLSVGLALLIAAVAFVAGYYTRKLTQGTDLSSFEWFLNTVGDNYYFDTDGADFKETALDELAEKYLDKYSAYYTAEEYKNLLESNKGHKSGIGISYSFIEGKGVYISSVVGNSPAYMAGIRAGEVLESGFNNGGEMVTFDSAEEFTNLVKSAGDGIEITLVSSDGESFKVAKKEYTASYTCLGTNASGWTFGNSASGGLALYETVSERKSFLPDGFAYISLSQFYGSAAKEFYILAEKFNSLGCTSLILDLRSNGGGYVNVMSDIAGAFAEGEKRPSMYSRDKKGKTVRYDCAKVTESKYRISADVDVYVLANAGTASASEALIGALVCYGVLDYPNIFLSSYSQEYLGWLEKTGQEIKNERTYGKGIMQTTFENKRTGEALKLTTAGIFWPDAKTSIHDTGITLSRGCSAVNAEWEHTKGDAELREAVSMITAKN